MENYDDSIDIFSLLTPLLRSRRLIAAVTVFFVLSALLISPFLKKFYEAKVKLFLGKSYDPVLDVGESVAARGAPQRDYDFFSRDIGMDIVKFYREILKSRPFLTHFADIELAVDEDKKMSSYDFFEVLKDAPGSENAISSVLENIMTFEAARDTGILLLTVKSGNKFYSIDCANAVTRELESYVMKFVTGRSREKKTLLEERLKESTKKLSEAEDKLKVFREKNKGIINISELQMMESKLMREMKIEENIYIGFLEELEKTKLFGKMEIGPLIVIEYASSAARKRAISPKLLLFASFFGGLFFSGFLSFIVEFIKKTASGAESPEFSEFKNGLNETVEDIKTIKSAVKKFGARLKRKGTGKQQVTGDR